MRTHPMCIANSSNQHHKYFSGRMYIGCDAIATKRNGLMRTCPMNIANSCNQHSKYISGEIWIRMKKFLLEFLFLSLSWFIKFQVKFKINQSIIQKHLLDKAQSRGIRTAANFVRNISTEKRKSNQIFYSNK